MARSGSSSASPASPEPASRTRLVRPLIAGVLAIAVAGSFWPGRFGGPLEEVGLQQSWDVFAPDPIHQEVVFDAVVTFADGSEVRWRPPHARGLGADRSHRWELW